jgi:hypothetical protein
VSLLRLWLAVAIAMAALPVRAADAADIRQKAEAVARELDVQQKLPADSGSGGADDERSSSPEWFPDGIQGPDVSAPAAIWNIVQWAILALAVITVVAWLGIWAAETYQQRTPSGLPKPRAGPGDAASAPLDPVQALALADEWAASGRYAPAMHQVWLAAVALLAPRLGERAPDSLTSWELLRAANLQAAESQALRSVVARVDRAWFGRQPAGQADYQAVRGSYQTFVAAAETVRV